MNVLLHFLIVLCGIALLPLDPGATEAALFVLMQLLILIFNLRTFKQGLLVGKEIVWQTLAKTMDEKNIESIVIKPRDKRG
jgi:hypothetical protein